jgi:hypothetical protein
MVKAGEAPSGEASASEVPALKAVGKAQEAAKAWLALIDDAKYAAGWDGAAAMLKDKVEKDFCVESIKAARAPFGTVKSRTLKSATYTTTLPGAPEGEYVVIQYDTQFENKSEVIETITPMLEKDGSWKVSGYFLKPVEKSKDAKPADSPAADSLKQSDSVETAVQSEQGSAGTENLLNNPGAEKGDETPEAWQQGDPIEGVKYSWDKKVASEGKASLCIEKTAKRYFPIAQWSQTVERKGDSSILEVSAQVKAQRMTKAVLDVLFLDKDGQWISHKWGAYIGSKKNGDPPANHNWKKYSGKVDVPPGTAKICIGLQVYGPGKVWFDDLRASYENSEPKNEKPDAIEEPSPRE